MRILLIMSNASRYAINGGFLLSPIIVGTLAGMTQPSDSVYGLVVIIASVIGIPLIGIVGLIVSIATRKSPKASHYSLIGFGIPAALVAGYEILPILFS